MEGTLLCVETDEWQHRSYDEDDEDARQNDIIMGWGGKMIQIRYNPHPFTDGDGCKQDIPRPERLAALIAFVAGCASRARLGENGDLLEIHHLFYDDAHREAGWAD